MVLDPIIEPIVLRFEPDQDTLMVVVFHLDLAILFGQFTPEIFTQCSYPRAALSRHWSSSKLR